MGEISPEILNTVLSKSKFKKSKLAVLLGISRQAVHSYIVNGVSYEKFKEIGRAIGMKEYDIIEIIQKSLFSGHSAFENIKTIKDIPEEEKTPTNKVNEPVEVYKPKKQTGNIAEDLKAVAELYKLGLLTNAEFVAAKAKILKN